MSSPSEMSDDISEMSTENSWAGSVDEEKLRGAPGDACYVTSRIIAAPMPTAKNVGLVCRWLLAETGPRFLLWDLSDDADDKTAKDDIWKGLTERVIRGRLKGESGPHEMTMTQVLRNIAAMSAWLELNEANRAVVCCRNGRTRSGLFLACLLRYAGLFESTGDALAHFYGRRSPDTIEKIDKFFRGKRVLEHEPPTSRILLQNFDVAMAAGGTPNGSMLRLAAIRIKGLAALRAEENQDQSHELPSLEMYANGETHVITMGSREDGTIREEESGDVIVSIPQRIPSIYEDFAIVSRIPRVGSPGGKSNRRLLFRYANHRGFLVQGRVLLDTDGIDVSRSLAKQLMDKFFVEMELVDDSRTGALPVALLNSRRRSSIRHSDFAKLLEGRDGRASDGTTTTTETMEDGYSAWDVLRGTLPKRLLGMQELLWRHVVDANEEEIGELVAKGYDSTAAELSLQLCVNEAPLAAAVAQGIMAMNGIPLNVSSMDVERRESDTFRLDPPPSEMRPPARLRSPSDSMTQPPIPPLSISIPPGKLRSPKLTSSPAAARKEAFTRASVRAQTHIRKASKASTLKRSPMSSTALSKQVPPDSPDARTRAIDSMIAEVAQVDGVTIEEIRDLILAKKAEKAMKGEGNAWPPKGPILKQGVLLKRSRTAMLARWQEREFILTSAVLGYAAHKGNAKGGERNAFALEEIKEITTSASDGRILILSIGLDHELTVRAQTAADAQEWQYAIDSAQGQAKERVFGRNPLMQGIDPVKMRAHAMHRLSQTGGEGPAIPADFLGGEMPQRVLEAGPVRSRKATPNELPDSAFTSRRESGPIRSRKAVPNGLPDSALDANRVGSRRVSAKASKGQATPADGLAEAAAPLSSDTTSAEQGEEAPAVPAKIPITVVTGVLSLSKESASDADMGASPKTTRELPHADSMTEAPEEQASPKQDAASISAMSAADSKDSFSPTHSTGSATSPKPLSPASAFPSGEAVPPRPPLSPVIEVENEQQDKPGEIREEIMKFVRMLKAGVPRMAVELKMRAEGFDAAELDSPQVNDFLNGAKQATKEEPTISAEVKKFVLMLKAGVPRMAVELKMQAEGIDAAELDSAEVAAFLSAAADKTAKEAEAKEAKMIALTPEQSRFITMLKAGVPRAAVEMKMRSEGVDARFLDTDFVRKMLGQKTEDDARFDKYKRMYKSGVPMGAIQNKMALDGLDPEALRSWFAREQGEVDPADLTATSTGGRKALKKKGAEEKATWKRRTLAWKEIKLDEEGDVDTIWKSEAQDIALGDDELAVFQSLFQEDIAKKENGEGGSAKPVKKLKPAQVQKPRANLIDSRRATNAGIAIKNIKLSNREVHDHIVSLNSEAFNPVQLGLLLEYWPTNQERSVLERFNGDADTLNEAEKFMRDVCDVPEGKERVGAMLFKATFGEKLEGVTRDLTCLQNACDDVRLSHRLRSLLRIILLLGNKINGDSAQAFTLDSLLKLSSAKSKDRKTTVLDYLVMLAERTDEDLLRFSEDLSSSVPASRVLVNELRSELKELQRGLSQASKIANGEALADAEQNPLKDFCDSATSRLQQANDLLTSAVDKFDGVLRYMHEEPRLSPSEFFSTLSSFIREFNGACDRVKKKHEAESRRRLMQESLKAARSPRHQKATSDRELGDDGGIPRSSTMGHPRLSRARTITGRHSEASGSFERHSEGGGGIRRSTTSLGPRFSGRNGRHTDRPRRKPPKLVRTRASKESVQGATVAL